MAADLSDLHWSLRERLPMWVVTGSPSDYPGQWVARLYLTLPEAGPTNCAIIGDSLDAVRAALPLGLTRLPRYQDDDPVIVEVWL